MTKPQRVRYEMFLRVRDFGATHRDRFPESSKGGRMFAKVAEAVAQMERQGPARLRAVGEGYHTASAREALKRWMLDLGTISRDLARQGTPGVVPLKMPAAGNDVALLAAARRFLEAGASFSDEIVQRGLGEQWAGAFTEAIEAFAARRGEKRAGRLDASTARASLEAALKSGSAALVTLDSIVNIALRGDAVLLPAWQQCRRVLEGRGKASEPVPAVVPGTPGEGDLEKAS